MLLIPGVLSFAWGGTVKAIAAGLGVEIEELREVHERLPAEETIDLGFGVVEKGTTAAMRFEVQGIVDGEPRIILEHVTRLDDALAPDWPQPVGHSGYRVDRHRQPELHLRRPDDGRRRRPQHRWPRRHRGPARERDPRGVRGARPACSRCSTCRWSPAAACCGTSSGPRERDGLQGFWSTYRAENSSSE